MCATGTMRMMPEALNSPWRTHHPESDWLNFAAMDRMLAAYHAGEDMLT